MMLRVAGFLASGPFVSLKKQPPYCMLLALGHSSMHGFPTTCGSGEKELNPAVVLNPRTIAQISDLYT
jgi:hypothetical protein